jgi:hypothetical protein
MRSESSSSAFPPFFPIVLLAVSLLILLVWQVVNVSSQAKDLKAARTQLMETLKQREPQAQQAMQMQSQLRALTLDLLKLAETDPKAQALVKKYNIPPASVASEAGK